MNNDERLFAGLSSEEQTELLKIKKVEDIQDVRFIRTWMADGLPAVALSLNGIELAFYDLDTDNAAALMNPNYTDSKASLLRILHREFGHTAELDDDDEFETEREYDSYGAESGGGSWG